MFNASTQNYHSNGMNIKKKNPSQNKFSHKALFVLLDIFGGIAVYKVLMFCLISYHGQSICISIDV